MPFHNKNKTTQNSQNQIAIFHLLINALWPPNKKISYPRRINWMYTFTANFKNYCTKIVHVVETFSPLTNYTTLTWQEM